MLENRKIRIVLDTNTIVSGLLWKGNESLLLDKIENQEVLMYITFEIIDELRKTLNYPRMDKYLKKSKTSIDELMNKVLSFSHIILENAKKVVISRDSEDNKIIECALSANADFIISGDNDLLILK